MAENPDFDIDWEEIASTSQKPTLSSPSQGIDNADLYEPTQYVDAPDWIKDLRRPKINFVRIRHETYRYAGIVDYSRKNKLSQETEDVLKCLAKERGYYPKDLNYSQFETWNEAFNNILDGYGIIDNEEVCYEIARHMHQLEKAGLLPHNS